MHEPVNTHTEGRQPSLRSGICAALLAVVAGSHPSHISLSAQGNPELNAVWRLLQLLWQRQYIAVWQALQEFSWSPQTRLMVDALSLKTREELIDLIGTAYSTVKPSKVASLCGLPQQEALAGEDFLNALSGLVWLCADAWGG